MRKNFLKIMITAAMLLSAGHAFALIDVQASMGERWYQYKNISNITSQEYTLGVHLDPIPLVPVAFGLSYTTLTPHAQDWHASSVTGTEANLEVVAWIPLVPIITPYAKLRYTLMGQIKEKVNSRTGTLATDFNLTGFHLVVGAKYEVIPLFSVFVEVDEGSQMLKPSKVTLAGKNVANAQKTSRAFNSQAILFGAECKL